VDTSSGENTAEGKHRKEHSENKKLQRTQWIQNTGDNTVMTKQQRELSGYKQWR
jgi:hypothetical protein